MNIISSWVGYTFPKAKRPARKAAKEPAASCTVAAPSQAPARVMVLEADPQSRSTLVDLIKAVGLEPLVVPDGAAALKSIDLCAPGMILMACNELPGPESGDLKLCSMMRKPRADHPCIPIIVLATGSDAFIWQGYIGDCGIEGVLEKPLRAQKLRAMLELWLDLPLKEEPKQSLPPIQNTDDWFQVRFTEDIQGFEQAWAKDDKPSMVRFAQHMQGIALVLGVQRALKLADRLERMARGTKPMEPEAMQRTLTALKKAFAPYLD
ncbi:response regulator [Dyella choica]|uniref:Response regulator n=1 Tax=Dyella choica TaxID=1927959 RepID=A0A432LZP2_9GAMM|nr:response regulator [Dyella choica]RUL69316.1 response regulator [Dyella choica]